MSPSGVREASPATFVCASLDIELTFGDETLIRPRAHASLMLSRYHTDVLLPKLE